MIKKQMYAAPSTEVLELRQEGVVCASIGLQNYTVEEEEDW